MLDSSPYYSFVASSVLSVFLFYHSDYNYSFYIIHQQPQTEHDIIHRVKHEKRYFEALGICIFETWCGLVALEIKWNHHNGATTMVAPLPSTHTHTMRFAMQFAIEIAEIPTCVVIRECFVIIQFLFQIIYESFHEYHYFGKGQRRRRRKWRRCAVGVICGDIQVNNNWARRWYSFVPCRKLVLQYQTLNVNKHVYLHLGSYTRQSRSNTQAQP